MNTDYLKLLQQRRSIYNLGKNISLSDEQVVDLVEKVIATSPTAFNNQTTRAVFLFGAQHDKLWDLTLARLRQEVPSEAAFAKTTAKIEQSFKAGHGTILFYTDMDAVHASEKQAPLYADNFQDWSEQGQGIMTIGVWTSLANNQIGASLQHYNPLIDDEVAKAFDIPDHWRLRAEMPYGSIEKPAGPAKDKLPASERFKVLK